MLYKTLNYIKVAYKMYATNARLTIKVCVLLVFDSCSYTRISQVLLFIYNALEASRPFIETAMILVPHLNPPIIAGTEAPFKI